MYKNDTCFEMKHVFVNHSLFHMFLFEFYKHPFLTEQHSPLLVSITLSYCRKMNGDAPY